MTASPPPPEVPDADAAASYAVIDLDGVVSDARHRVNFLDRRPKDWDSFFAAAPEDPVLPEGRAVVAELLQRGHEIVWLTGRPERCRRDTLDWLKRSDLPDGRLFMRANNDHRPARQTKLEVLRRLQRIQPVAVMVDDDDQVVRTLRAAGFNVLHATWMTAQPTLFEAQEAEGRT